MPVKNCFVITSCFHQRIDNKDQHKGISLSVPGVYRLMAGKMVMAEVGEVGHWLLTSAQITEAKKRETREPGSLERLGPHHRQESCLEHPL